MEDKRSAFDINVNNILCEIGKMLSAKNKAYGNSALEPVRVFSKASASEQLKVRMDDKLSRIAKGSEFLGEDVIDDLIGYLVLYKIQMENNRSKDIKEL